MAAAAPPSSSTSTSSTSVVLKIKIFVGTDSLLKGVKVPLNLTIDKLVSHIASKFSVDRQADHGIYLPAENGCGGKWLSPSTTVSKIKLAEETVLEFRRSVRVLRFRTAAQETKSISIDEHQTAGQIIERVCRKLGVSDPLEYGFILEENKDSNVYLSTIYTLPELGINSNDILVFRKRLFGESEERVNERDPAALHLLYCEVQSSYIAGKYPSTLSEAVELGALQCQLLYGDYSEENMVASMIRVDSLVPPIHVGVPDLVDKIVAAYRDLRSRGFTESSTKYKYIQVCRALKTYGITMFKVREPRSNGTTTEVILGISRNCLLRIHSGSYETISRFKITQLQRWSCSRNHLTIDFGKYAKTLYRVETQEGDAISQLLSGYIDIILAKNKAAQAVQALRAEDEDEGAFAEDAGAEVTSPKQANIPQQSTPKTTAAPVIVPAPSPVSVPVAVGASAAPSSPSPSPAATSRSPSSSSASPPPPAGDALTSPAAPPLPPNSAGVADFLPRTPFPVPMTAEFLLESRPSMVERATHIARATATTARFAANAGDGPLASANASSSMSANYSAVDGVVSALLHAAASSMATLHACAIVREPSAFDAAGAYTHMIWVVSAVRALPQVLQDVEEEVRAEALAQASELERHVTAMAAPIALLTGVSKADLAAIESLPSLAQKFSTTLVALLVTTGLRSPTSAALLGEVSELCLNTTTTIVALMNSSKTTAAGFISDTARCAGITEALRDVGKQLQLFRPMVLPLVAFSLTDDRAAVTMTTVITTLRKHADSLAAAMVTAAALPPDSESAQSLSLTSKKITKLCTTLLAKVNPRSCEAAIVAISLCLQAADNGAVEAVAGAATLEEARSGLRSQAGNLSSNCVEVLKAISSHDRSRRLGATAALTARSVALLFSYTYAFTGHFLDQDPTTGNALRSLTKAVAIATGKLVGVARATVEDAGHDGVPNVAAVTGALDVVSEATSKLLDGVAKVVILRTHVRDFVESIGACGDALDNALVDLSLGVEPPRLSPSDDQAAAIVSLTGHLDSTALCLAELSSTAPAAHLVTAMECMASHLRTTVTGAVSVSALTTTAAPETTVALKTNLLRRTKGLAMAVAEVARGVEHSIETSGSTRSDTVIDSSSKVAKGLKSFEEEVAAVRSLLASIQTQHDVAEAKREEEVEEKGGKEGKESEEEVVSMATSEGKGESAVRVSSAPQGTEPAVTGSPLTTDASLTAPSSGAATATSESSPSSTAADANRSPEPVPTSPQQVSGGTSSDSPSPAPAPAPAAATSSPPPPPPPPADPLTRVTLALSTIPAGTSASSTTSLFLSSSSGASGASGGAASPGGGVGSHAGASTLDPQGRPYDTLKSTTMPATVRPLVESIMAVGAAARSGTTPLPPLLTTLAEAFEAVATLTSYCAGAGDMRTATAVNAAAHSLGSGVIAVIQCGRRVDESPGDFPAQSALSAAIREASSHVTAYVSSIKKGRAASRLPVIPGGGAAVMSLRAMVARIQSDVEAVGAGRGQDVWREAVARDASYASGGSSGCSDRVAAAVADVLAGLASTVEAVDTGIVEVVGMACESMSGLLPPLHTALLAFLPYVSTSFEVASLLGLVGQLAASLAAMVELMAEACTPGATASAVSEMKQAACSAVVEGLILAIRVGLEATSNANAREEDSRDLSTSLGDAGTSPDDSAQKIDAVVQAATAVANAATLVANSAGDDHVRLAESVSSLSSTLTAFTALSLFTSYGMSVSLRTSLLDASSSLSDTALSVLTTLASLYEVRTIHEPASKATLSNLSAQIAVRLSDLTAAVAVVQSGEEVTVDPSNSDAVAEADLVQAAASIEAAAKKLDHVAIPQDSGAEEAVFDGDVISGAKSIAQCSAALLAAARATQKEIADAGRLRPDAAAVYNAHPQWQQGLVSAAQAVAGATNELCEAANAVVRNGSEEMSRLIAAAQTVSSETAHLVMAAQVNTAVSVNQADKLKGVAKSLKVACNKLVEVTKERSDALAAEGPSGSASSTTAEDGGAEGTSKVSAQRQLMQQRQAVLEMELKLEQERKRLLNLQKQQYDKK